ncbi:MAG TPA: cupredoxin domain-containing protein [Vicinamibacterales bacterium]|nr:cupredoxin domain-containing protein [Vicinamibacterales bacterium]
MHSRAPGWIVVAALFLAVSSVALFAQARRDFSVTAKKYGYTVSDSNTAEIRVHQNDMVTITFTAEDIPHSFTISDDHYRIDRRAEKGKPVTFKFLADKAGEFEIRCILTADQKCKDMVAKLIVSPAK